MLKQYWSELRDLTALLDSGSIEKQHMASIRAQLSRDSQQIVQELGNVVYSILDFYHRNGVQLGQAVVNLSQVGELGSQTLTQRVFQSLQAPLESPDKSNPGVVVERKTELVLPDQLRGATGSLTKIGLSMPTAKEGDYSALFSSNVINAIVDLMTRLRDNRSFNDYLNIQSTRLRELSIFYSPYSTPDFLSHMLLAVRGCGISDKNYDPIADMVLRISPPANPNWEMRYAYIKDWITKHPKGEESSEAGLTSTETTWGNKHNLLKLAVQYPLSLGDMFAIVGGEGHIRTGKDNNEWEGVPANAIMYGDVPVAFTDFVGGKGAYEARLASLAASARQTPSHVRFYAVFQAPVDPSHPQQYFDKAKIHCYYDGERVNLLLETGLSYSCGGFCRTSIGDRLQKLERFLPASVTGRS